MITGVDDMATLHQPHEGGTMLQDSTRAFWQGALLGVATVVITFGMLVLSGLSHHGSNAAE